MQKVKWIAAGALIGMAVLAFLVVGSLVLTQDQVASAQAPTATPTAVPKSGTPAPSQSNIGTDFWQRLATKLGLNVNDLTAKAVEARKDMLDQAVKDGRITQAEADQLKSKLDANGLIAPINIGRGGAPRQPGATPAPNQTPSQGFGRGFAFGWSADALEAVAKVLNLQPTDLVTQLRGGKTLADIATAQKVDQAVVKQAIIDAEKAAIDRELKDGLITQAQADARKANLTPDKIDLTRMFLNRGFPGRR